MEAKPLIPFNIPPFVPKCKQYVEQAMDLRKISGDGSFTRRCNEELQNLTGAPKVLLTTSGTSALEMAALLTDVHPGDEVILPSFTFVSTANAFALRGARLVFVDVKPDTMNIDPACVRAAVTDKTRVIVPVHYAGMCCDMDELSTIAKEHNLLMVEDAAQAVGSYYKGRAAGAMSDVGCFSFHETKNFSMGEGGAVVLNKPELVERAEIIREKGTDRSRFFRGQVDKYTWVDIGSSFLPSELNAAYLLAQLEQNLDITKKRMSLWSMYNEQLADLEQNGLLKRMTVPEGREHNAHMYYILLRSMQERSELIAWLREREITAVFHYIPLHSTEPGRKYGRFAGEDRYTTELSERLLRLPLYYEMTEAECSAAIDAIHGYFTR